MLNFRPLRLNLINKQLQKKSLKNPILTLYKQLHENDEQQIKIG